MNGSTSSFTETMEMDVCNANGNGLSNNRSGTGASGGKEEIHLSMQDVRSSSWRPENDKTKTGRKPSSPRINEKDHQRKTKYVELRNETQEDFSVRNRPCSSKRTAAVTNSIKTEGNKPSPRRENKYDHQNKRSKSYGLQSTDDDDDIDVGTSMKQNDLLKSTPMPRKYKNYKIIPEWDLEESKLLSSVAELECVATDQFIVDHKKNELKNEGIDCLTLTAYKQLQAQLSADKRLESIRRGSITRTKIYTDEEILEEMVQVYGDLDKTSERFQLLFENYKESFMEQVQLCEEDEAEIVHGLLSAGHRIVKHDFNVSNKTREEIRTKFALSMLHSLENLGAKGSENEVNWLDLPKPNTLSPEKVSNSLYTKWIERDEEGNVGLALGLKLDELIREYPAGITPEIFLEKFFLKYKYHIDYESLGFLTSYEFFEKLPCIFHIVPAKNYRKILLFSYQLRNLLAPMHLTYMKIRHLVLQVIGLNYKENIPTEDIPKLLYKYFGFSFDCMDWGFACWKDFLGIQLECDTYDVTIDSVKRAVRTNDLEEFFLVSDDSKDQFQKWKAEVEKETEKARDLSMRQYLPIGYSKYYEKFANHEREISPGDSIRCVLTSILNPFTLSGVPCLYWNRLEKFQHSLQAPKWSSRRDRQETEVRSLIQIGLPVLVYCPTCDEVDEWHRGIIISRKRDAFVILMIDYGCEATATMDKIRYLPNELGPKHLSYAIFMQLKMPSLFKKYRKNPSMWTEKHQQILYSLCVHRDAFITFHSVTKDTNFVGFNRWTVSITIIDKNSQVIIPDLYEALFSALVEAGLEQKP